MNKSKRGTFLACLGLAVCCSTPELAAAWEHQCFYGPRPWPEIPLNPTLWQSFSFSTTNTLVYRQLTLVNTERMVPDTGVFVGGEVFTYPISFGDTSEKEVALVYVPVQAVWRLSGVATMAGTLALPTPIGVWETDTCFSQGLVTPAG